MKLVAVAALLLAAAALVGFGHLGSAHGSAPPQGGRLTVTGSGTVRSVPDRAELTFGVESTGATARVATAANAARAQAVVEALRRAGISKGDLQTQDVSVGRNWDDEGHPAGFQAHTSVLVTVRGVARAGTIVDTAVAAGATETSGPSFDRSDRDALYRQALASAFGAARAKAEALAAGSGAGLGAAVRIEEAQDEPVVPMYARALAAKDVSTPVEPGTQEIQASVTVTFALG
jgi:hypothetical protein